MKKMAGILGGVIIWMLCGFGVRADSIWEPEDSFYWEHAAECNYVSRVYTANGPDGVVIVYKSPENPEIVEQWENGRRAVIVFTYQAGGVVWGVYDDYKGNTGWMPMDYMEVVYDDISFEEDYGGQFVQERGELEQKYLDTEIYFWEYPGAEDYLSITAQDHTPEYSQVFVDEAGNRWGKVTYYFGMKNMWVCMDRPGAEADQLYPDGIPVRDKRAEGKTDSERWGSGEESPGSNGEGTRRIVPKKSPRTMAVTMALVLLVTAVTALLLGILRKGKNRKKAADEQ